MIKAYLDWNIITHLKENKNDNLRKFMLDSSEKILYPYSQAHFQDLMRSAPKDGAHNKWFDKDLEMLDLLSKTALVDYDVEGKQIGMYVCTPRQFYESLCADDNPFFCSIPTFNEFMGMLDQLSGESQVGKLLTRILQSENFNFDLPDLNNSVVQCNTLHDAMEHCMDVANVFFKDKKVYKAHALKIRETSGELQGKIDKSSYDNVFDLFDDIIITHEAGNGIVDVLRTQLPENVNCDYTLFLSLYILLDIIGYNGDKRRTLENIVTDGIHAYYASYCDFFVTDDRNLFEKAKAIYTKLGIRTKIIDSSQVFTSFSDTLSKSCDLKSYFEKIDSLHVKYIYSDISVKYWKQFELPLLGAFNLGSFVCDYSTGEQYYLFEVDYSNVRGFLFYIEVDYIIDIFQRNFTPAMVNMPPRDFCRTNDFAVSGWMVSSTEVIVLYLNSPDCCKVAFAVYRTKRPYWNMQLLNAFVTNKNTLK